MLAEEKFANYTLGQGEAPAMNVMDWLRSLSHTLTVNHLTAFATMVVALAAVIVVPTVLVQLSRLLALKEEDRRLSRQQAAREIVTLYMREFRTPQMGRAIASLWDLYRLARRNPRELVRLYIKLYRKERNHAFHFEVRRRVSVFFQHLALLAEQEECAREEVYRIWSKSNLDVIPKVLLPLEVAAIPEIINLFRSEVSRENYMIDTSPQNSIKAMERLYANAPEKLD